MNDNIKKEQETLLSELTHGTGIVYDARLLNHDQIDQASGIHPENPVRIYKIYKLLQELGLLKRMKNIPCREVNDFEILYYHDREHLEFMQDTEKLSLKRLKELTQDGDSVYFNKSTHFCARLSCGGVLELLKEIALNNISNGIAVVRPPGHHAEKKNVILLGFCFFNNVVIGVEKLRRTYGVKKVLILDWDVHHGNGIEDAFINEKDVLYISLHRYGNEFYPMTGHPGDIGKGEGIGRNVNIAFTEKEMGDADYIYAFIKVVMPMAMEFNPELVVISAGFDAAKGDPIGEFKVTPDGYAMMTYLLKGLANGKLAVCLEGGYNPDAIAKSVLAVCKVLLGDVPNTIEFEDVSEKGKKDVYEVISCHAKYWNCMRSAAKILNLESY
ncbi:histone deacetylase superfamily, partial [Neoconidiobolus thromboides FSU 785]